MENKQYSELLELKVDIITILLEMTVKNDNDEISKLITKIQKLIK